MSFEKWCADYLEWSEDEVRDLVTDQTVSIFLIGWSLLESSRLSNGTGYAHFEQVAREVHKAPSVNWARLKELAEHFHIRYQDKDKLRNLYHTGDSGPLKALLQVNVNDLAPDQIVTLLLCVIHRYRNNIFHGNKGVQSWLKYKEQIENCIESMQIIIPAGRTKPT